MKELIESLQKGTFNPNKFNMFNKSAGKKLHVKPEYRTESVEAIRSPSHAWPFSEYKHTFTKKYQKQLLVKLTSK